MLINGLWALTLGLFWPLAQGSAIDVQVDEKKAYNHVADSVDLLCYVGLLCLTIITSWAFKTKRLRFLHESGLAVFYGLGVGLILRLTGTASRTVTYLDVKPMIPTGYGSDTNYYVPNKTNTFQGNPLPDFLLMAMKLPNVDEDVVGASLEGKDEAEHPLSHVFKYDFGGEYRPKEDDDTIEENATFNPEIFFYVLLPPIIFHAGYSMRRKAFFDNLGAILAFALVGTMISTIVIAFCAYGFAQFLTRSVSFKFSDMLLFGAIISATDPVTVLTIFHDLHVDADLNGLILGESLLNDAVAIVLVGSIENYSKRSLKMEHLDSNALIFTILSFFTIFIGSVGLGSLIGAATALMTKFTLVKDLPLLETSLFFLMSYSSYLIAEICQMSGIVSVLFCGIFQAHYTYRNLSVQSQQRTRQLFETLNFLSENFIFSYLGVSMFTFGHHYFSVIFILGGFVAIAAARAMHIYPLSFLLNLGRAQKIPYKFQHMLWFSGLRGAMAFALAMRNTVSRVRQLFFTTTCVITISTVIFNGGLTIPVLTFLEIPVGARDEEREELLQRGDGGAGDSSNFAMAAEAGTNMSSGHCASWNNGICSLSKKSWLARIWRGFDSKFMKPLLTSSRPSLMETMPRFCAPCAQFFTSAEQRGVSVPLTDEGAEGCVSNPEDNSAAENQQPFRSLPHQGGIPMRDIEALCNGD